MRGLVPSLTALLYMCACSHHRSTAEEAMVRGGDCAQLLRAADEARAHAEPALAKDLADGCSKDGLVSLAAQLPPAEALLLCGRAKAAGAEATCGRELVVDLAGKLHPRIAIGPPDPSEPADPVLLQALAELRPQLNLTWDADEPDLIVGKLVVSLDHAKSGTVATVADANGNEQRVRATQHRAVARCEAQVDLSGNTKTLRASEEARDLTWEAAPALAVPARSAPRIPSESEMHKRAVVSWVRALAKAIAAAPPETIAVADARGCVAYGLAVNRADGHSAAAANGAGDPEKISGCEKILDEPAGAGIPVP